MLHHTCIYILCIQCMHLIFLIILDIIPNFVKFEQGYSKTLNIPFLKVSYLKNAFTHIFQAHCIWYAYASACIDNYLAELKRIFDHNR